MLFECFFGLPALSFFLPLSKTTGTSTMQFFNDKDVPALRAYAYKSIDKSLIANKILNPYWWSVIINYVPAWVAPNLITLTGFLCVVLNVLICLYFSPDLLSACPSWCYISFALGLFVYQSLDAIDGKQARKTGTSGPLGELFDHGCDALNTGFATFLGVTALNMGQTWWQILAVFSCLANFFLSTWEEYYTGTLYLSECSGPIEGVLSMCLVLVLTAVYGRDIWVIPMGELLPSAISEQIPVRAFLDMPVNEAFVYFGLSVVAANVLGSLKNVNATIRRDPSAAQKAKRDPPAITLLPFPLLSLLLVVYPALHPQVVLYSRAIVPYIVLVTFLTGYQVSSIIVAHISKRAYPWTSMTLIPCVISGAGLVYAELGGRGMTEEVVWAVALASGVWYVSWFVRVVTDLCQIFDIWCLRIKDKKGKGKAKKAK
ncbi:CDP-alcohol phosphatidyltransferase-domain-containing protein [Chytriomyces sp. MP71]|nr:CDP-alcohol phosphatidyltransferase-domain-containing protein [Chytriomyces sp. MP71]